MSPSVSTGLPHSRSLSVSKGGPVAADSTLRMSGANSTKAGKRVYPHIEDLINVRPSVDINSPIRKILQDADLLAKQADTHLDFRRPDLALQEHLQASRLVAEIIPRHKDYPSLQGNQGELHRGYTGLVKRIKGQEAKFDAVVKDIKEDNLRSGVKPSRDGQMDVAVNGILHSGQNGHSRSHSVQAHAVNGASLADPGNVYNEDQIGNTPGAPNIPTNISNGEHVRKKPPVQPKPQALHGKALQSPIQSPDNDLTARFARLRSPQPQNTTQDPRIRTQPITIPSSSQSLFESLPTLRSGKPPTTTRPSGPREILSVPTILPSPTKVVLDVQIPDMPKPPDAIYSPAGSTDSAATINLPSSVNRNVSYLSNGRKNSTAPPVSSATPTPFIPESMPDYFSPAHKVDNGRPLQRNRPKIDIELTKDGQISSETVFNFLAKGLQILLVDIRSREEFDRGHIMSKSIVCIEPIIIREGISADELGESNVLSPDAEQKLYENRNDFDLLVYYDQSSKSIKTNNFGDNTGNYLERFSKAVYDYGYEKRLEHQPLLLIGGLDAWVDLLGPNSLQTSTSVGSNSSKPTSLLYRSSVGWDLQRRNHPSRNKSTRQSRLLSNEEEIKWDETIKKDSNRQIDFDGQEESEEFSYSKTTADFLRKYPDLPSIQESMISAQPQTSALQRVDGFDSVPRPPTRPPPALPRQRSSGINERGPTAAYAMTLAPNTLTPANPKAGLTGLDNYCGVTCYANTVLQCLSATQVLRDYLIHIYQYPTNPRPPRKGGELGDPPQLLTRNLANLLTVLWSGNYDWVMPKTLLGYVNALNAKQLPPFENPNVGFGGHTRQHDGHEFLSFIFDVLMDELNLLRDQVAYHLLPGPSPAVRKLSIMDASILEWKRFQTTHDSIFIREFAGLVVNIHKCSHCSYSNRSWVPFWIREVYFPMKFHPSTKNPNPPRRVNLQTLLDDTNNFSPTGEAIPEFGCDNCTKEGKKGGVALTRIAYLPNYLVLNFPRFGGWLSDSSPKIMTQIDLDLDNFNMKPYHITNGLADEVPRGTEEGFKTPPNYEAYAIAMHLGKSIGSGHYVALVRNVDKTGALSKDWTMLNDKYVTKSSVKELEREGFSIAILFLRKKGLGRPRV